MEVEKLIPAPEWWALYEYNADLGPEREPLVGWALHHSGMRVEGLVVGDDYKVVTADKHDPEAFAGYYRTGAAVCICAPGPLAPAYAEDPAWCPDCKADRPDPHPRT